MNLISHPVDTGLLRSLSAATEAGADEYLASARRVLATLVARPGLLEGVSLERKPGTYARNLLFGDDRMSLWAMVWDVGASTSVHDHHCSCCFAMLSGSLLEARYRAIDDRSAVLTQQVMRNPGHIACMMPDGPNLHQMINQGSTPAVSLHIYGYDHHQHASSVHRTYQVAAH